MAITNIFKLHSLSIQVDPRSNSSPLHVAAMESASMSTDVEVVREITAGRVFPQSGRINMRSVGMTFTTKDIKSMLDTFGVSGGCINTSASQDGIYLNVANYDCSAPKAGAVHTRYLLKKGLIVPQSLSVDHQGDAMITYQIVAVYDGTNEPLIQLVNQNLPTLGSDTNRWTMSHAKVNNVTMGQKTSFNVDFGVETSTRGSDSDNYDSYASVDAVRPTVTIRTLDPTAFTALGGKAVIGKFGSSTLGSTNTWLLLRRRDTLATSKSHIVIGMEGLGHITTPFDGQQNAPGEFGVQISPIATGTNSPLMWNTGVGYTDSPSWNT